MTDITLEQRARVLLAAELDANARAFTARQVRSGADVSVMVVSALRAIEAALRLSAGADWSAVLALAARLEAMEEGAVSIGESLVYGEIADELRALAAAPRHEPGEG